MTNSNNNSLSIRKLRGRILNLHRGGIQQREIARRLDISQAEVSRIVTAERKRLVAAGKCPCCGHTLGKEMK